KFDDVDESEREPILAESIGITIDELRRSCHNCLFLLKLVASNEQDELLRSRSTHWLAGLTGSQGVSRAETVRALHYYGYKGGQARSTLVAATAVSLARNGWNIL